MKQSILLLISFGLLLNCSKQSVSDYQLAEQYRLLGSYDLALQQYAIALDNGENKAGCHYGMGIILETRDKLQQAEDHYKNAMNIRADLPGAVTRIKMVQGKKLIDAREFDKAYQVIREVLITEVLSFNSAKSALQTNNERYFSILATALINKGSTFEAQKEWDKATAYFKKAVEINSRSAEGHLRLGAMHRTKGKTLTALKHLSKAQQIDPEAIEAGYLLGHCYYTLKDYENAYREWLKVKSVRPGYRDTRKRMNRAWNKKMWEFLKFQTAVDSIALNLQEISQMKNELREAVENYKQLGEIVERAGDIGALKQRIDTVLVYQEMMHPMIQDLSGIAAMQGDLKNAIKYQIVLKDILVGLEDISNMKDRVMEVIGHQEQTHKIVTALAEIADMKPDLKRATEYQNKIADVVASLEKIGKLRKEIKQVLKYQENNDLPLIVENLGQISELKDELTQAKTTVALTLAMLGSQTKQSQQTLISTLEHVQAFLAASDNRITEFIINSTDKQLNAVVEDMERSQDAATFVDEETVILWQQVINALSKHEKKILITYLEMSPEETEETMTRSDLNTTEKYLIEAVQSLGKSEKSVVMDITDGTYSAPSAN